MACFRLGRPCRFLDGGTLPWETVASRLRAAGDFLRRPWHFWAWDTMTFLRRPGNLSKETIAFRRRQQGMMILLGVETMQANHANEIGSRGTSAI